MKVYADIRQEVSVNPKEFLKRLKEMKLGYRCWVKEVDGKYYSCYEDRNCEFRKEISKEFYDFITALNLLIENVDKDLSIDSKEFMA